MAKGKKRIRVSRAESEDINIAVESLSDRIIAARGLKLALVIVRKMHERIYANYKRMEKTYGKIDW